MRRCSPSAALDLVVNNAGLSLSKPLLETTEADWDLQHDVMAKGSFLVSKAAAQVLIDQELGGDIVYISSKNSVFAGPNNIAYSATKADQAHQVRLLAVELGEYGVRVNGINPDGVVRGSGIFAGGWGANRAAVYGVRGGGPRQVLRAAHAPQARGAAGARRQRRVRAHRSGPRPHDRPAHPRRRRASPPPSCDERGAGQARRGRSTSARPAGGSCSGRVGAGRRCELDARSRAFPNDPGRAGTAPDGLHWDVVELYRNVARRARARRVRAEPRLAQRRRRLVGGRLRRCCATGGCSAARSTTATSAAPRAPSCVHARVAARRAVPRATACSSCRSTRSTSSRPTAATDASTAADSLLLIPDLIAYWLTRRARRRAHQRVDDRPARRARRRVGRRADRARSSCRAILLPAARRRRAPRVGALLPSRARRVGARRRAEVTAVGSHDTASAVVAVPMRRRDCRLHLVRHLGARRRRARASGAHRGGTRWRTSPTRAASTGACASCTT